MRTSLILDWDRENSIGVTVKSSTLDGREITHFHGG